MSAIQQIDVSDLIPAHTQTAIRNIINRLFWQWYEQNKNDKLTRVSLFRGLIRKTVYLRDLQPAFELLFGPSNGLSSGT